MNLKEIFRENMRLTVYDKVSGVYYKSVIQEVNADNIAIGVPLKGGEQLLMQEGSSWVFIVTVEDALYYFVSQIESRKVNDNIPLYLISWPETARRFQRRKYFRIECNLDLQYWVLKGAEKGPVERLVKRLDPPREAVAVDLSGGGLLLVTSERLTLDTTLALRLLLRSSKGEKAVYLKGKVIRDEGSKDKTIPRFRYGLKYIDLEEQLREEIIRFVFLLSRERLR